MEGQPDVEERHTAISVRQNGELIDGRYTVVALLGVGATGSVYRCMQTIMDTEVAVKILHPELLADRTAIKRFQNEARAASMLSHSHITKVLAFGLDSDSRPYIAMELIDGCSLASIIKEEGPMEPLRLARIMLQACDALGFAHNQAVLHRDLKPANLMLETVNEHDSVKIADFGLSKILTQEIGISSQMLTRSGSIMGTPAYMSPEQCSGVKADSRSDIYALGCTMYEALTAQCAFSGDTAFETMHKHISLIPPPVTDVHPQLAKMPFLNTIIERALAKNPDLRYQTASELAADLNSFLQNPHQDAKPQVRSPVRLRFDYRSISVLSILFFIGAATVIFGVNTWCRQTPSQVAQHALDAATDPREKIARMIELGVSEMSLDKSRAENQFDAAVDSAQGKGISANRVRAQIALALYKEGYLDLGNDWFQKLDPTGELPETTLGELICLSASYNKPEAMLSAAQKRSAGTAPYQAPARARGFAALAMRVARQAPAAVRADAIKNATGGCLDVALQDAANSSESREFLLKVLNPTETASPRSVVQTECKRLSQAANEYKRRMETSDPRTSSSSYGKARVCLEVAIALRKMVNDTPADRAEISALQKELTKLEAS